MTTATMTDDEAKTSADIITYRYTDSSLDVFTLIFVIEHDDDYKDDCEFIRSHFGRSRYCYRSSCIGPRHAGLP